MLNMVLQSVYHELKTHQTPDIRTITDRGSLFFCLYSKPGNCQVLEGVTEGVWLM